MIPARRRPAAPLRRLDGRMSRRGLLAAGVLAGVLAASGVPLQARTRGGVLRLGLARAVPEGPGSGWAAAPAVLAQGAVHDTLTEIGPTGELLGELAQSWEAAPGARLWHLALRPDAAFHDGRPLGAEDVLASLARHREGPAAWLLARIERMEAQGPRAVRILLREGDPDFPFLLADPRLAIGPDGAMDGTGTGLYRLAEVQVPGRLRLERVPSHWKDGRAGWFDAVEALSLPDPARRLEALLAGEVDAIDPLPPPLAEEARRAGFPLALAQGNRQLQARLPEGTDPSLATLLPRAIDRKAVAAAWGGRPAADHPLGLLHPALSPLTPPSHDPEAAAWLLARAGLDPADLLVPWNARPTEDAAFESALAGPWSPLAAHPDLRRHLAAARAAQGSERAAHYAAAQAICAEAAPVAVAAHVPTVTPHAPGLAHDALSGLAPFDGGRIAERWWWATA